MLRNYLTIAGRQLIKNGRYTLINIAGLSVALACCLVAYLNYDFSYGFDKTHENAERIYRVYSTRIVNDSPQEWGISPMPLGPALKAQFPFVEESVRILDTEAVVRREDRVFNERVHFADPAILDLFTFPLSRGTSDVLSDPGQIIISPALAVKYFGLEDPVGRQLTLRFGEELRAFAVGAVTQEIPKNSSIQFDILLAYENMRVFDEDLDDWRRFGEVTFLEVSDPGQMEGFSERLSEYTALQNSARPDWEISRFSFVSLKDMFLTSPEIRAYVLTESLHPAAVVSPAIIALLLLLMACFNFMNTAIAFASKRLKEIGVRKVMGGHRRQLIAQFLSESMLLSAIAFGLSLLLAEVFAPAYSSLWPYLDLQIVYADNAPLLAFLGALLLVTGLFAGAYPAYYISSFTPVEILRGRQRLAGLNRFTKTLLTFQLATAATVILLSIVFTNNARFQETIDLGYDMDMVLMVPLGEPERFSSFRDALAQNPDVLSVAGSRSHISYSYSGRVTETLPADRNASVKNETDVYEVGDNYLETMGLKVIAGRSFDVDMETDFADAVMVNQTFAREFALDAPVGETILVDSTRFAIIGVFEDFYDGGLWDLIEPAVFRLGSPDEYRFLTARVWGERLKEADSFLRETWQRLVPEQPYDGMYQDFVLAEAMLINRGIRTTFSYIAGLAILIAAAGLFGLMSLAIARRTKEIGIRKVLGATVYSIASLINREFIIMLVIASMAAAAAGYYTSKALLDSIWAYHSGVGILPAVFAALVISLVALVTVGRQVWRIATSNPVHALRYE